jgi:hypothetical protein
MGLEWEISQGCLVIARTMAPKRADFEDVGLDALFFVMGVCFSS